MSEWERPDRAPRDGVPQFEIPLAGDAPVVADGRAPTTPNWRKVAGLSALAGVALGIVAAVVIVSMIDDGEDGDMPTTTVDPDELTSAITVPPTLTPITEPTLTLPPESSALVERSQDDPARVAASVTTLPQRPDGDPVLRPPDGYRLSDGSLAALDTPLARRSVTDYVVGVDGFEQTVTITNDPTSGRYLLEFDFGGEVEQAIVDLPGGKTFVQADAAPGGWTTVSNEEVAETTGAPDMATFVRNLQLGPIRSDTRNSWVLVRPNALVDVPGEDLREYVVVLDAAAVSEWARYAFGPTGDAAPLPGNTLVGFAVYVDQDGSIRRVSGASEYGATTQRIVHRLEELDTPPVIELPVDESTVTEPPVDEPSPSAPPG